MATIIWKEPKPQGTAKSRYKARRATMVAERRDYEALGRKVAVIATGCSVKVQKAVTAAPNWRVKPDDIGAICIPDVAIYAAGFRKPTDSITAR